jgi:hypothetical protein
VIHHGLPTVSGLDANDSHACRRRFLSLSQDVFRELGEAPPCITLSDDEPLCLELDVGGLQFELTHESTQKPFEVLMGCVLPALPPHSSVAALDAILAANHSLVNQHRLLSLDPDTHAPFYAMRLQLADLDTSNVLALASEMAQHANAWMAAFALDDFSAFEQAAHFGSSHDLFEMQIHQRQFDALMDDFQRLTGGNMVTTAGEQDGTLAAETVFEGVVFRLIHGSCHDRRLLAIECVFGPTPAARCQSIQLEMLHINRALADITTGAGFTRDAQSGDACFVTLHPLADLQATRLESILSRQAIQARAWQSTNLEQSDPLHPRGMAPSYQL